MLQLHIIFFNLRYITFNINYFLALEGLNKGEPVSSDSMPPKPNGAPSEELSPSELNAKNYIEQYKSQFPRESIKTALVNTGIPASEVEKYLDIYF